MSELLPVLLPVLLVEDTTSLAVLYAEQLKKSGIACVRVETAGAALTRLREDPPTVMVLDLQLPDGNGIDILQTIAAEQIPTSTVVITSHGSVNTAVAAMQAGAADFIVKPFSADRLVTTVRNTLERQRLREMVAEYRDAYDRKTHHGFIGSSPAMQAVYRTIDSVAASKATVFITGESGTGKEVCAEAIHRSSPRRGGPFVAINCGAIPRDLMESELFGHVKGAFTGASADRDGAASRANGGTLFLDELCEMDLNLQTKLLRFIQSGAIQKVGGGKLEKVDIRIVCATNRDPLREVEEGRLREDLFYRLHVIPVHLPPLRERADDMVEIARALLADYAREEGKSFVRFAPEVEAIFRAYGWPGNVRQLQNVIRNVVVLHDAECVSPEMLPATLAPRPAPLSPAPLPAAPLQPAAPAAVKALWRVEKEAIEAAIRVCDGSIPAAAALLEVAPSTIYRKKQAWEAQGIA